ncbi:DDT domain-containing protein DDR4 isoform X2 [Primulina huaijiensis]|uniref:DDT domain-containing protein DDR4 isoform X2 n=1 Tax=Primulina huaijiensis TaxID=1492673 RepID=UPI003CC76704
MVGDERNDDVMVVSEQSSAILDVDTERKKLRQRWELASVLNFLKVFKPIIGNDMKISAQDIETALITQNETLAQLHVMLLKGILPLSKGLNSTDVWITVLSKKLEMWWPWVAEGDFPFRGAKGNAISIYKELDPTTRLLLLKAICEVRADQHDAVSYINETIRSGTEVSTFRKEKLAGDGNGIAFWYDGNEIIGHRLYKEVCCFETERVKRKGVVPAIISLWETIATNLEEFQNDEFSSSRVQWKVACSESIKTDVIPVLKRHLKKKQRALQLQRELLNGFRNSGIARTCRNNRPIDYRFDNYDKAIKEAIQFANKRKTTEEQKSEENSQRAKKIATTSDGAINSYSNSRNSESTNNDFERSSCPSSNSTDDSSQDEHSSAGEDGNNAKGDVNQGRQTLSLKQGMKIAHRSEQLRFSKRLAGIPGHTLQESMILGAKNRLRQRPSINTAVDSVVPDSEEEDSSRDTN